MVNEFIRSEIPDLNSSENSSNHTETQNNMVDRNMSAGTQISLPFTPKDYDILKKDIANLQSNVDNIKDDQTKLNDDIEIKSKKLDNKIEKITPNMIEIIGIFVAILSIIPISLATSAAVKTTALGLMLSIFCYGIVISFLVFLIRYLVRCPKYPDFSDNVESEIKYYKKVVIEFKKQNTIYLLIIIVAFIIVSTVTGLIVGFAPSLLIPVGNESQIQNYNTTNNYYHDNNTINLIDYNNVNLDSNRNYLTNSFFDKNIS